MVILFAYSLVRKLAISVISMPNRVRKLKKFSFAECSLSDHSHIIFIFNYSVNLYRDMRPVRWKNLHLITEPVQCMMTGELYYIPIERATEYCVDINMLSCYHVWG